jgi:hypothetical protein
MGPSEGRDSRATVLSFSFYYSPIASVIIGCGREPSVKDRPSEGSGVIFEAFVCRNSSTRSNRSYRRWLSNKWHGTKIIAEALNKTCTERNLRLYNIRDTVPHAFLRPRRHTTNQRHRSVCTGLVRSTERHSQTEPASPPPQLPSRARG